MTEEGRRLLAAGWKWCPNCWSWMRSYSHICLDMGDLEPQRPDAQSMDSASADEVAKAQADWDKSFPPSRDSTPDPLE